MNKFLKMNNNGIRDSTDIDYLFIPQVYCTCNLINKWMKYSLDYITHVLQDFHLLS